MTNGNLSTVMTRLRHLVIVVFLSLIYCSAQNSDDAKAELEQYILIKKPEINQRWRMHYHVMPPVGWMNDPNGFSFYKGVFHLFYQFYPYDSVWGPMHWGHVSSYDLVTWKQLPIALLPEKEMCFSGSAVADGDTFILMYTGREIVDVDPFYNETQYIALSDDGINFQKYDGNPVLPFNPDNSPDFRDPKVWRHGDHWYVIIGSKTTDERGRVLLYRSEDMINWEFLQVLGESNGEMGYMWECPDFFELNGKFILLMSPQGLKPKGDRYKNTYQTGYIIGSFNYETFEFVPEVEFQEIDFGHDFYAATTMEHDGKRYLIAWFNMWEVPHPEDVDGWAGAMTLVREIELVGNSIVQKPLEAQKTIREGDAMISTLEINQNLEFGKALELIIEGNLDEKIELCLEGKEGGNKTWIRWDPDVQKVIVDRGSEDIRQVEWSPIGSRTWRLFLDASSMELFCGDGEVVFSSRIYPLGGWRVTNQSPQSLRVESYSLKRSFPE